MDIVWVLVAGVIIGLLIGGTMGFDRGWRAGVSWAQARIFGH